MIMFTSLTNKMKAISFTVIVLVLASVFGIFKVRAEIYMFVPVITVFIMFFIVTRDGYRKISWGSLGLHRTGKKIWLFAFFVPFTCLVVSYVLLWMTPAASFVISKDATVGVWLMMPVKILLVLFFYTITSSLGEELGWRGYLLPILLDMGWKKAIVLTGFIHGIFHVPIMLNGLYHPEGNALITYPLLVLTTTLGGILFGYVTIKTRSIWPAAIMHAAHNVFWAALSEFSKIHSEVGYYLGGESGVFMVILYGAVAVWILKKGNIDAYLTDNKSVA